LPEELPLGCGVAGTGREDDGEQEMAATADEAGRDRGGEELLAERERLAHQGGALHAVGTTQGTVTRTVSPSGS